MENEEATEKRKYVHKKHIELNVDSIKYSQSSISNQFSDGRRISDTVKEIKEDPSSLDQIERIKVVRKNGEYVSLDNRRLFALREAKKYERGDGRNVSVERVYLKHENEKGEEYGKEFDRKNTPKIGGKDVRIRDGKSFGQVRSGPRGGEYYYDRNNEKKVYVSQKKPLCPKCKNNYCSNGYECRACFVRRREDTKFLKNDCSGGCGRKVKNFECGECFNERKRRREEEVQEKERKRKEYLNSLNPCSGGCGKRVNGFECRECYQERKEEKERKSREYIRSLNNCKGCGEKVNGFECRSCYAEWKRRNKEDYEERKRIKHEEYLERQRKREEYQERKRRNHEEYLERQRQREERKRVKHEEYLERQRKREEYQERKRIQHEEYLERQQKREEYQERKRRNHEEYLERQQKRGVYQERKRIKHEEYIERRERRKTYNSTPRVKHFKGGQYIFGGGRAPRGGVTQKFYKGGQFTPGGGRAPKDLIFFKK